MRHFIEQFKKRIRDIFYGDMEPYISYKPSTSIMGAMLQSVGATSPTISDSPLLAEAIQTMLSNLGAQSFEVVQEELPYPLAYADEKLWTSLMFPYIFPSCIVIKSNNRSIAAYAPRKYRDDVAIALWTALWMTLMNQVPEIQHLNAAIDEQIAKVFMPVWEAERAIKLALEAA